MPDLFKNLSHEGFLLLGGGFAGLCGSLSYLLKVEEGKPFKWSEFLLHLAISAAFGVIAFEIMTFEHIPDEVAAGICGMSGWMGTRIARIIEIVIRKKLGISKQDMEGK